MRSTVLSPLRFQGRGAGGNAKQFKEGAGLDEVADREGFLAVFPNGSGPLRDRLLTWNAGGCCRAAQRDRVDDVDFSLEVLVDLARRTPVDGQRVFATGHSNGAMMAYRLGMEAGDRIAAIAPVGGAMIVDEFRPVRPLPVLHIHSVDDRRAPYEGGEGPPFPTTNRTVLHRPVVEGLEAWIDWNGCRQQPDVIERIAGGAGTRNRGQTAIRMTWAPCASGSPVEHWRLTGAGHGWPGDLKTRLRESVIGPSTTIISAAEETWEFFRRFSIEGTT